MDALRRAEAGDAPQKEPRDALSEADAQPASNSPLQLEPLEPPAAVANDSTPEVGTASAQPDATEKPPVPETAAPQAQSVLETFAIRQASARRHLIFAVSGLLSAAAVLTAYYFWQNYTTRTYQVAPTAMLIDAPVPVVSAEADATPPAPAVTTEPATATAPPAVEPVAAVTAPVVADEADRTHAAVPAQPAEAVRDYRIEIRRTRQSSQVPPALQQAYRAYRQGDYVQAEEQYRRVLKTYPANRDAMLGLAAIALHQGQRPVARYYYERLVKADPSDKVALLALQGLSGGQYSLENGSKLKYWLQGDGSNAQLHFALGNQYAASGQWKEAQQSYFEAYRLAPGSADYAFNLAVSLDHLGLAGQALTYYLQAQQLAGKGGALFNIAQLDRRILELQAGRESAR